MGHPKSNGRRTILPRDSTAGTLTTIIAHGEALHARSICRSTATTASLLVPIAKALRVLRANPTAFEHRRAHRYEPRGLASGNGCSQVVVGIAFDAVPACKSIGARTAADNGASGQHPAENLDIYEGSNARRTARKSSAVRQVPEPIDIDLDLGSRLLYWTDRGEPAAWQPSDESCTLEEPQAKRPHTRSSFPP